MTLTAALSKIFFIQQVTGLFRLTIVRLVMKGGRNNEHNSVDKNNDDFCDGSFGFFVFK